MSPLDEAERRRHRLRNLLHTWLLILGSGALVALIAWILFGTAGLVWAAVLTGIGLWSAGQVSPKMVLGLYRAKPLSPYELPELHSVVRQLAARADLPAMPELYYVPSRMMNAFAVGRPEESAIAVTDGLLRGLNLRQLTGVLAHESDPQGLASALVTLERRQGRFWEGLLFPGSRVPDPSLLRTHPSTEARVERLMSLTPAPDRVIDVPARWDEFAATAPPLRHPRIHWHRMGTWY